MIGNGARLNTQRLKNSAIPTTVIMVIGAFVGVFVSAGMVMLGYLMAGATSPLAALLGMPMMLAFVGLQMSLGIFIIPLWALLGGGLFGGMASGATGSVATNMGVTLLPDVHPINVKVQEMAQRLNLPPIKWVGHFESDEINAFACGQEQANAMVAFSVGCIEKLNGDEFEAVLAHELAHVANNDMKRMTYARGVQSSLTFFLILHQLKVLARWLFTFISEIEILRFSRKREYFADAIGAVLTSPEAMIGALARIQGDDGKPRHNQSLYANMMFSAKAHGLFRTHPPLNDRINALEKQTYIEKLPVE